MMRMVPVVASMARFTRGRPIHQRNRPKNNVTNESQTRPSAQWMLASRIDLPNTQAPGLMNCGTQKEGHRLFQSARSRSDHSHQPFPFTSR